MKSNILLYITFSKNQKVRQPDEQYYFKKRKVNKMYFFLFLKIIKIIQEADLLIKVKKNMLVH